MRSLASLLSPNSLHVMSVEQLRPFPTHFRLKDLAAISGRVFEFKLNPHEREAAKATYAWFDR